MSMYPAHAIVFLAAFAMAGVGSGPAAAQDQNKLSFEASLKQICPAKNLEFLKPDILAQVTYRFVEELPQDQRRRITELARGGLEACRGATDESCRTAAVLGSIRHLDMSPALAQKVCALRITCRDWFVCSNEQTTAAVAGPAPLAVAPASPGPVRDCDRCPELVVVRGGTFQMGSQDDASEQPVRSVTVASYAIGREPVTGAEWHLCVADRACDPGPTGEEDGPVHNVSFAGAQRYVTWLARISGLPYRLPSEAEWEYAARAGTTSRYWWGARATAGTANCKDCGSYTPARPVRANSLTANPFGLFGMGGGVAQWVSDCWRRNYTGAPRDGSSWDAPNCRQRVLRGGSWMSGSAEVTVSARNGYDTTVRYAGHGLRVARSLKPGE